MRLRPHNPRRGFTLLEVLLAATIGVLLMGALYVAVDIQVRHAQAGRDIVEQSALGRALLARINRRHHARRWPDRSQPLSGSGGSSGASGGTATTTTSATAATTTSSNSATSSTTSASSSTTTSPTSGSSTTSSSTTSNFNFTVQGDSASLTSTFSQVPREVQQVQQQPGTSSANSPDSPPIASDVRRIAYWLAGGGDSLGLARQELLLTTSDDASAVPPNIPDEASFVIAPEGQDPDF